MAVMVAEITQAVMAVMVAEITQAVMAVMAVMGVEILIQILLLRINLLGQKVGKIEVMEILLKTQNMKVVEVGEKEEYQMRVMYQMRRINNPFLQV